jgi:hypothetical protein
MAIQLKVVVKVGGRHSCICFIFYFKTNGINMIVAKPWIIQWNDIIYIVERQIKRPGWIPLVFLEQYLHAICFIWIKVEVGKKRNTVCVHKYTDHLLKTCLPRITRTYVVNHKLDHNGDVHFREPECCVYIIRCVHS